MEADGKERLRGREEKGWKKIDQEGKKSSAAGSFGVAQSPKSSYGGTLVCYPPGEEFQEEFPKKSKKLSFLCSWVKQEETDETLAGGR
jgi:hypothetical protein